MQMHNPAATCFPLTFISKKKLEPDLGLNIRPRKFVEFGTTCKLNPLLGGLGFQGNP